MGGDHGGCVDFDWAWEDCVNKKLIIAAIKDRHVLDVKMTLQNSKNTCSAMSWVGLANQSLYLYLLGNFNKHENLTFNSIHNYNLCYMLKKIINSLWYLPCGILTGIVLYLWDNNDKDLFLFSDLNNQMLIRNSIPKLIINAHKFYFENTLLIIFAVIILVVFVLSRLDLKQIERRIKIGWENNFILHLSFYLFGIWGFLEYYDTNHLSFTNETLSNLYLYSFHKVNNLFFIGFIISLVFWVLYINIKYINKILLFGITKLKLIWNWLNKSYNKKSDRKEDNEIIESEESYDLLGLPLSYNEFETKFKPFIENNYGSDETPAITKYFKDLNKSRNKSMLLLEKVILVKTQKSYSFGITGDWGMGKTTFLNLIKYDLENHSKIDIKEKVVWLDFNPWNFSNSSELITDFFSLLNSQLSKLYGFDYSNLFQKYFELVTPLTEKSDFTKTLVELGQNIFKKPESLGDIYEEIREKMNEIDVKFIITLDDLDRMAPEEVIMIVFKLVKSLANFPNIIFILSYDPAIIKKAIFREIKEVDGGSYLQKIINFSIPISGSNHEQNKYSFEEIKVILAYYVTSYFKLQNIKESTKEIFNRLTEILLFKYWRKNSFYTNKIPSLYLQKMICNIFNLEYFQLSYKYQDGNHYEQTKLITAFIETPSTIISNFTQNQMGLNDFKDIEKARNSLRNDMKIYEFQDSDTKSLLDKFDKAEEKSKLVSKHLDDKFLELIAEYNFTPRSIIKLVINFKLNLENQGTYDFRDISGNDRMNDEIYKIWDQSIDEFLDW